MGDASGVGVPVEGRQAAGATASTSGRARAGRARPSAGAAYAAAREGYEGKVIIEVVGRHRKNRNLNGFVHEVMARDRINVAPRNIVTGTRAQLTRPGCVRDDLILKRGGRIVGRMQLKDTSRSIRVTLQQVKKGKYARTLLGGTKETARGYAKDAVRGQVTQRMVSTGVSSSDTARIADKGLGRLPKGAGLAAAARGAGIAGAAMGAGFEAIASFQDLKEGKLSAGEYAGKVAKEGVKGGVTAAAAATASSVTVAGATAAVGAISIITAPAWVPVAAGLGASVAVGCAAKKLLDWIW